MEWDAGGGNKRLTLILVLRIKGLDLAEVVAQLAVLSARDLVDLVEHLELGGRACA